jgi:hypothetical protein
MQRMEGVNSFGGQELAGHSFCLLVAFLEKLDSNPGFKIETYSSYLQLILIHAKYMRQLLFHPMQSV